MEKIRYMTGGTELLDLTEPLWTSLKHIHSRVSPHFSDNFLAIPFSARKAVLLEKSRQGMLRADLAQLADHNTCIGYCISTITQNRGEIESLFVAEDFRNLGIGGRLMQNALEWMEAEHVKKKIVCVVTGNERAYPFYARYGFFPRTSVLMQKK